MSDHPECQNCDFFRKRDDASDDAVCMKHNFVMPRIDWQTICKDWQTNNETVSFQDMEEEMLYYYSYGSGDILIAPLAHFRQLQFPLISVSVRQDKSLGWVIYPRKQNQFFPAPDSLVTVYVGERKSKFQIVNMERNLAVEMVPRSHGWEKQVHTQQVFMLGSLESPNLLYDWSQSFMDFDAFIDDSFSPSLFAFLEVLDHTGEYVLHPDLLTYEKYVR